MSHIFYDHLIPWDKVDVYIHTIGADGEEKLQIIELVEETIHTETLTVILSHLPEEKHEEFIERFHAAPHDEEHLSYLKAYAKEEIEEKIRSAVDTVINDLIADLEKDESEKEV
jgi:hypothetical protein